MAYTAAQAHAYYMNYTKLKKKKGRAKGKGKKKSSGISKEVRKQCNAEVKQVRERIKAEKKEFMRQYREAVKQAITNLREEMKMRLKGMPKGSAKDALRAEYQGRIKAIQELKKAQTEQFNDSFQKYKEDSVNAVRAKYGMEPLESSAKKESGQKAELTSEQKDRLSGALGQVKNK